jgi:hypothetical protein
MFGLIDSPENSGMLWTKRLKYGERNEWPTAFMIDGGFWRSVRTSALPASA